MPALTNRSTLEWWDGSSPRASRSAIVNISHGGLLMESDDPPPAGHYVWVRLDTPSPTPWVGGRVVRADDHRAAIAFHQPCPLDFYEAAVLGIGYGHIF